MHDMLRTQGSDQDQIVILLSNGLEGRQIFCDQNTLAAVAIYIAMLFHWE